MMKVTTAITNIFYKEGPMKRFFKIILCAFLVLSFVPHKEVKAEGTINNIHFDSNGFLAWDEVPGTEYYLVEYYDENHVRGQSDYVWPYSGWSGPTFDLMGRLATYGYADGQYMVEIRAYTEEEILASGNAGPFYYDAIDKMTAPALVTLLSDWTAWWNLVPDAEWYIVTVFRDGFWWDEMWVSGDTTGVDLGLSMIGEKYQYSFKVKARRTGYEDSDFSPESNTVAGMPQNFIRLSGKDRYETSRIIAANVRAVIDDYKDFDAIFVATGKNYPDALSGAFLANWLNAPLLMIDSKSSTDVVEFINNNLAPGGIVYILGGEGVVPNGWLDGIDSSYVTKRLSGKTRYHTNLAILDEFEKVTEYTPQEFLVCTGENFADSLSCSALGIPMLLVKDGLNADQKAYLSKLDKEYTWFYIIGGTGAVSEAVENELLNYGKIGRRVAGKNRYETSVLIADYFGYGYYYTANCVLATGQNFPDGLSAGPLAYHIGAPLLLVKEGQTIYASNHNYYPGVRIGYIAGGTGAVSDEVAMAAFNVDSLE